MILGALGSVYELCAAFAVVSPCLKVEETPEGMGSLYLEPQAIQETP